MKSPNTNLSYLRRFNKLMDQLYTPNPKYTPDPTEQEIHLIRNKGIVLLHILSAFAYILDVIVNDTSLTTGLFRVFVCFAVNFFLYLSSRYHPQIFKVMFLINCTMYGPLVMNAGEDGVHSAWAMSTAIPVIFYILMGDFKQFLLQIFLQAAFVNSVFSYRMEEAVLHMTPSEFVQALNQSSNQVFATNFVIVLLMNYQITKTTQRVMNTERRRADAENQKTFLFSFSHELRNLINSLTGNVKLAGMDTHVPERVKELLSNAEACGELLLYLVNNILDTGKAEVGELEVDLKPTKIYNSFEKIWGICSELIRRKDLRGRMLIQKDLPKNLLTDQYRLTQIFINLIGNAIKFTERGSINITVEWLKNYTEVTNECFEPHPFNEDDDTDEGLYEKRQGFRVFSDDFISLDLQNRKVNENSIIAPSIAERGVLKIAISDTGCGMNKDQTNKLFHKFTQVTADASKRKLGTGLGLFIIKQICERMNGEAKVFSKQDKGSCFIFCIPTATVSNRPEPLQIF